MSFDYAGKQCGYSFGAWSRETNSGTVWVAASLSPYGSARMLTEKGIEETPYNLYKKYSSMWRMIIHH